MALLDSIRPDRVPKCWMQHTDCTEHPVGKPDPAGWPNADPPKAGRCWCGAAGYLWNVPLDGRWYCRKCIRDALKRATWPFVIRFPEDR